MPKRDREEESTEKKSPEEEVGTLICQYCGGRDGALLPLGRNYFHSGKCMAAYSEAETAVKRRVHELVQHGKHMQDKAEEGGRSREALSKEVFEVLDRHYSDPKRFYHTFTHIADMLTLSAASQLLDRDVVDWAILYHDVIYDAKSGTNEEDSAALFKEWAAQCRNSDEYSCFLVPECAEKVHDYILETKKHDVCSSTDHDLQCFIDFDMSVLGWAEEEYERYCHKVRLEYSHVSDEAWIKGRGDFLRGVLAKRDSVSRKGKDRGKGKGKAKAKGQGENSSGSCDDDKPVFATPEHRDRWECFAERNMRLELAQLVQGSNGK